MSEFGSIFTSGIMIAFLQKWLKTFDWYGRFVKAFPGADKWAHRFVAFLFALIAAIGIHWHFDGSFIAGGVLTINIPSMSNILHGAYEFLTTFSMQQYAYATMPQAAKAYVNPTTGGV